jgi:hypothetical protein
MFASERSLGYIRACYGSGCVPVDAPVFNTGDRSRRASGGGFDPHPLPPVAKDPLRKLLTSFQGTPQRDLIRIF